MTRCATAAVRDASPLMSVSSSPAKYVRMTSASVSTGTIDASTKARNSLR